MAARRQEGIEEKGRRQSQGSRIRLRSFFVRWKDDRFQNAAIAHEQKYNSAHADGSETSASFDWQQRADGFAEVDSGGCVGLARGYRYTRDRKSTRLNSS